MFACVVNMLYL